MIAIVARQIIKKSALAEYDALVKELVEKSRQEEGNVSYVNVQDREDERIRIFLELWKDQDAIDIHHATPMMATIAALREKYDLHMHAERYISEDLGTDGKFIRK